MNSHIQSFIIKMCLINSELFRPRRRQRRNKRSYKRKKIKSKPNWRSRWQAWRSTPITSPSMVKTPHSSIKCTWSTSQSSTRTPAMQIANNNLNWLILVHTHSRVAISHRMVSNLNNKSNRVMKTRTMRIMRIAKLHPLCLRTKSSCHKIKTW